MGYKLDRLLFEKSREQWAIWQEYYPLTGCLKMMVQDLVFVLDIRARTTKQINPKCLWLVDTQFSYAGAQCAAVEPKDLCSPAFTTHFPIGLLKYPENMAALNLSERFLRGR
jgi:hypothetical protein